MNRDTFSEQTLALIEKLEPQERALMRLMIEQAVKEATK
jgi:hypothetical protein